MLSHWDFKVYCYSSLYTVNIAFKSSQEYTSTSVYLSFNCKMKTLIALPLKFALKIKYVNAYNVLQQCLAQSKHSIMLAIIIIITNLPSSIKM